MVRRFKPRVGPNAVNLSPPPGCGSPRVIPAKAGIQSFQAILETGVCPGPRSGIRRSDKVRNLIFLKLMALGPTRYPQGFCSIRPLNCNYITKRRRFGESASATC